MHRPIPVSPATPPVPNSIRRSPLRRGFPVILLALAFTFVLSPMARAVNPPPDGGYDNGNTAEGDGALFSATADAVRNTAIGYQALYSNRGGENTATGAQALFSNTTGFENTANGASALYSNTTGNVNTATGGGALGSNTTGSNNTATGVQALVSNTIGLYNTATGVQALLNNTTGNQNTANGVSALASNTTGRENAAQGFQALFSNGTGNFNTANGVNALFKNTTGSKNTGSGFQALLFTTSGHDNIATGNSALQNNTTGSFNIGLGSNAGANLTTGSNNIDIGHLGVAGDANTTRLGAKQTATFIAGIRGANTGNGDAVPVVIDSAGQLGTLSSSRRFKDEIKPMNNSSEAILGLNPVIFHYKSDSKATPQFGLIAEEVAKVNPDLVVRDDKGEIYTVRYDAVNAMLLNEFLKEHQRAVEDHRKVEEQGAMIVRQQKQIEALTAGLQKVTARVEAGQPTPLVVSDN